ncbi:MAG: hypothetical protein DVB31_12640, partial [Verrucomicrobia bacterium]
MNIPSLARALLFGAILAGTTRAERISGGRFAIDGSPAPQGGGFASGGRFSIQGTVGQPGFAPNSPAGGRFSLDAGFVSAITVVQVAGAPTLAVQILPDGSVRIRWDAAATGFVLQGTADIVAGPWEDAPVKPT